MITTLATFRIVRSTVVPAVLILLVAAAPPVQAKVWTDATGKHKYYGDFIEFKDGKVRIFGDIGETIELPMSRLCQEDQQYVRELLRVERERKLAEQPPEKPAAGTQTTVQKPPELTSSETTEPTTYESRNFILHTDVTKPEARLLLESLETVLANMSAYWGRPLVGRIECYVVRDLRQWSDKPLDSSGISHIAAKAGVTLTSGRIKRGSKGTLTSAKAVVYACADRGIAQHESVHAYCGQTFGQTGPTWYAEGMAEMGQYWVKGSRAVNVPDSAVRFLQRAPHKLAITIVNEQQISGDSWESYTRRWALCHLLNHNTNYSARFRTIGQAIVDGQKINYQEIFGARTEQIEFEFKFFVDHVQNGFRADLCSWDWSKRFLPPSDERARGVKIFANRGWQPTTAAVTADRKYDFISEGSWSTGRAATDGDGGAAGRGKLVGILMNDMQLGEPFELGASGTFSAPADGDLYVRCQDDWSQIGDNSGSVMLRLRAHNPDEPLVPTTE